MAFDFDSQGNPLSTSSQNTGFDFDANGNLISPVTKPPTEPQGDTMRGFTRAFAQVPELAYGTGALASMAAEKLFGEGGLSTSAKDYFASKFAAKQAENQKYAPTVEFTDAWDNLGKDPGKMVDWIQDSAGYVVGQGIQTIATGGLGAIAGRMTLGTLVAGSAAKAADKMVAAKVAEMGLTGEAAATMAQSMMPAATAQAARNLTTALGSGAVLFGQNLGMEAGDIYGGLIKESEKTGQPITGADVTRAWLAAGAAAGTELVTDMLGLGALTGRIKIGGKGVQEMTGVGGRVARAGTAAAIGMPVEGAQEWVQTGFEQFGAGQPLNTPEAAKERINAAAVGALGGGLMGGGIGAIQGAQTTDEAIRAAQDVAFGRSTDTAAAAIDEFKTGEMGPAGLLGAPSTGPTLIAGEAGVGTIEQQAEFAAKQDQQRLDAMVQPVEPSPGLIGSVPVVGEPTVTPDTSGGRTDTTGVRADDLLIPDTAQPATQPLVTPQPRVLSDIEAYQAAEQKQARGELLSSYERTILDAGPVATPSKLVTAPASTAEQGTAQRKLEREGSRPVPVTQTQLAQQEQPALGPVPTTVGGINEAQLDNEQLTAIIANPATHANTRRAAQAVLGSRMSQPRGQAQPAPTQGEQDGRMQGQKAPEEVAVAEVFGTGAQLRTASEAPQPGERVSTTMRAALTQIGRLTGTKVVFVSAEGADGATRSKDGNTVYINVRSSINPLQVMGHETMHVLRKKHREAWAAIRSAVEANTDDAVLTEFARDYWSVAKPERVAAMDAAEDITAWLDQKPADVGVASTEATVRDFLMDEMISDLGGNRWSDPTFWDNVFQRIEEKHGTEQAKGIIQRLVTAVKELIARFMMIAKRDGFAEFKTEGMVAQRVTPEQLREIQKAIEAAYATFISAERTNEPVGYERGAAPVRATAGSQGEQGDEELAQLEAQQSPARARMSVDEFLESAGEDGLGSEYTDVARYLFAYTQNMKPRAINMALESFEYPAYKAQLDRLLRSTFPDGKIPVTRIEGYAGKRGAAVDYISVSINPGWGRASEERGKTVKRFVISAKDVVAAGNTEEGELVVARSALEAQQSPRRVEQVTAEYRTPKEGNHLGFQPAIRTIIRRAKMVIGANGKPETLITQKTNNANAEKQLKNLDYILATHPDPTKSADDWNRMSAMAYGTNDVPVPPYALIERLQSPAKTFGALIGKLTDGQNRDADHGFANAKQFRRMYLSGKVDVETTGKLFLWSFLSRGVSPYVQEGLFVDAVEGVGPFVKLAAQGKFDEQAQADYAEWSATVAPEQTPGKAASHNLNAFGSHFLTKMSVPDANGKTSLQKMHDMMTNPKFSGKMIRREFQKIGQGVGIDNKVVSFTLLVSGYEDVLVLDRVQIGGLWNDGRFDGYNLYDGVYRTNPETGDREKVPGSGLANLTAGVRGLLQYEALERAVAKKLPEIYEAAGRPKDASLGRFHWDTWVAYSNQEASHGTLDAILKDAMGEANPYDNVTAKEGEYSNYNYGTQYGRDRGGSYFVYSDSTGKDWTFSPHEKYNLYEAIGDPRNGVIPRDGRAQIMDDFGFLIDVKKKSGKFLTGTDFYGNERNAPWVTDPRVNREKLDELIKRFGHPATGARAVRTHGKGATAVGTGYSVEELRTTILAGLRRSLQDGNEKAVPQPYRQRSGRASDLVVNGTRVKAKVWEPEAGAGNALRAVSHSTPDFLELSGPEGVDVFSEALVQSKNDSIYGAAVYVYDKAEYAKMRLFVSRNGAAGFAVKKDGDIVSVFSRNGRNPAVGQTILHFAVQVGGRKLDAFDTRLPYIYAESGFTVTARTKWNDEYAPEGWDKQTFGEFNNGEPDVVFMAYDLHRNKEYQPGEGDYAESYEAAVASQIPKLTATERPDATGNGSDRAGTTRESLPRYGRPADRHAVSVVGVHYSREQRRTLSSAFFGTGMKGEERLRVSGATDPRIKRRLYFYANTGRGIVPESDVGIHAHSVGLDNVYDMDVDPLKLYIPQRDGDPYRSVNLRMNDFESAVIDAGYDGYMTREFGTGGAVVLLGDHAVPVQYEGAGVRPDVTTTPAPKYDDLQQLKQRIAANRALPSGQMSGADWKRLLMAVMPEVDPRWLNNSEMYYKGDLLKGAVQRSEIRSQADVIKAMTDDQRDNLDPYEFGYRGYVLYEAEKLMPKKDGAFKSVTENNSFALWQEADAVVNVDGKPYLATKQEDPDDDADEGLYVWSFSDPELGGTGADVQTDWADKVEAVAQLRTKLGVVQRSESRATPWYYSELARAVDNAPAKAFTTGKQFAVWIQSNSGKLGVKKQEIEATGITDWLQTQDRVTREQVAAYLEQGGVKVTETVLGDNEPTWFVTEYGRVVKSGFVTEQEAWDWGVENVGPHADVDQNDERIGEAKFADYQLPGGENYKEWLLTLPGGTTATVAEKTRLAELDRKSFEEMSDDERIEYDKLLRKTEGSESGQFRSNHFPGTPNILAHVRTNERTDAEGRRVLFIEEIQSDFGQSYRKQVAAIQKAVDNDFEAIVARMEKDGVLEVNCD